jgi:hypothetical protein
VACPSPSIFPSRLPARALTRGRDQVGDRYGVGQPLMRWNLMDGAQMRVPLGRRDVPMAHHFLANGFGLAEFGQQGRRRVPQRVEGGAVNGAPKREPRTLHGAPQAAANRLDGPPRYSTT